MVFGFGKKRPPPTFKERVSEFWRWYPQVADRFYQEIQQGRCQGLTAEVVNYVEKTMPTLGWVFGPGENGGHSFTVTGEGVIAKQLLTEYWRSQAPQIPHWTFYASRQPTSAERLKDMAINLNETEQVDTQNFLIKTHIDENAQLINIVAWHPALKSVPPDHHLQILFLLLDDALGEFGTEMWLGEINVEPLADTAGTITLDTLPAMIENVNKYYQWAKLSPLEAYRVYECNAASSAPRGDTLFGSTCIGNVILDFLENGGKLSDNPIESTGAEFAYIAIDGSVFPDGSQVEVRGNIEDAVRDALEKEGSGRTLGGAFGLQQSYIDLLFFDGENSRRIVERVLQELQLAKRSRIESLA